VDILAEFKIGCGHFRGRVKSNIHIPLPLVRLSMLPPAHQRGGGSRILSRIWLILIQLVSKTPALLKYQVKNNLQKYIYRWVA